MSDSEYEYDDDEMEEEGEFQYTDDEEGAFICLLVCFVWPLSFVVVLAKNRVDWLY
jgi:hypothetical protein